MVSDWVKAAIDLQRKWENRAKRRIRIQKDIQRMLLSWKNVGSQIYLYPIEGLKQDAIIKLTAMWQYYFKNKTLKQSKSKPHVSVDVGEKTWYFVV